MGKRGTIQTSKALPVGTYQSFDSTVINPSKNILVHRIAVWLPDGNDNVGVFVKRHSLTGDVDDVVDDGVSLVSNISFAEGILLTPEFPCLKVWIRDVLTAGTFRLNIDYEEVS